MTYESSLQKLGFRELEPFEIEAVNGGYLYENNIPDVFEDPFPSIAETLGIFSWSGSGDAGQATFGADEQGNFILVFSSGNSGGVVGTFSGTQSGYDPNKSSACNWAHALSTLSTWTGHASTVFFTVSLIPDPSSPVTAAASGVLAVSSFGLAFTAGVISGSNQCYH